MHYVVVGALAFIAGAVVVYLKYRSLSAEFARVKTAVYSEADNIEKHIVGGATVAAVDVKYFTTKLRSIF